MRRFSPLALFLATATALAPHLRSRVLTEVRYDDHLLTSLLHESGLEVAFPTFRASLRHVSTPVLHNLVNATMDYIETNLSATDEFLGVLDSNPQWIHADASVATLNRIAHWIHIFETFHQWTNDEPWQRQRVFEHFDDLYKDLLKWVPPSTTNAFERTLGAPTQSKLKSVLTPFEYVKFIGIKMSYNNNLNCDTEYDAYFRLRANIYEAIFQDALNNNWENVIVGHRQQRLHAQSGKTTAFYWTNDCVVRIGSTQPLRSENNEPTMSESFEINGSTRNVSSRSRTTSESLGRYRFIAQNNCFDVHAKNNVPTGFQPQSYPFFSRVSMRAIVLDAESLGWRTLIVPALMPVLFDVPTVSVSMSKTRSLGKVRIQWKATLAPTIPPPTITQSYHSRVCSSEVLGFCGFSIGITAPHPTGRKMFSRAEVYAINRTRR